MTTQPDLLADAYAKAWAAQSPLVQLRVFGAMLRRLGIDDLTWRMWFVWVPEEA